MMTAQEIFDKVCVHLKKQRKKAIVSSASGDICAYRGADGTMCAVGCLIPDDKYNPGWEGVSVSQLPLKTLGLSHLGLLCSLQAVHDGAYTHKPRFKAALKAVAEEFGLEWKHG